MQDAVLNDGDECYRKEIVSVPYYLTDSRGTALFDQLSERTGRA